MPHKDKEARRAYQREYLRTYRERNGDKFSGYRRRYYEKNKESILEKARAQYAADPQKFKNRVALRNALPGAKKVNATRAKLWCNENKERRKLWARRYRNVRYKEDPSYKASLALRSRFRQAVRRHVYEGRPNSSGDAVRLLGCALPLLVRHIESQWSPGMSWDNWTTDGWHIDHIIPLACFDLTDEAQRMKACHYTNLRPMWAKENLSKGSKLVLVTKKESAA